MRLRMRNRMAPNEISRKVWILRFWRHAILTVALSNYDKDTWGWLNCYHESSIQWIYIVLFLKCRVLHILINPPAPIEIFTSTEIVQFKHKSYKQSESFACYNLTLKRHLCSMSNIINRFERRWLEWNSPHIYFNLWARRG